MQRCKATETTRAIRVGLVGVGLAGQAAHAGFLAADRRRFQLVAIADPSPALRHAVADRFGVEHRYASHRELLADGVDAVVCAAPDVFHAEVILDVLDAGVHVLCEKPLALTAQECDAVVEAADRSGLVVQVGTMKRFDPAFLALLDRLPAALDDLTYVSVEVCDPGSGPFVAHHELAVPDRRSTVGRPRLDAELAAHAGLACGRGPLPKLAAAFAHWMSSLVHDVSLLAGILERLGGAAPRVQDAALWDDGRGVALSLAIGERGRAHIAHLNLPGINNYAERVTVYCRSHVLELSFPSPYLHHHPTRLVERRSGGGTGLVVEELRVSYEEAFRDQLRSFHTSVVAGAPVVCDARAGRADVKLLLDGFRAATVARLGSAAIDEPAQVRAPTR